MAKSDSRLLVSYYGDDFSGSTDVMEALGVGGVPTALFLDPPSKKRVHEFRLKNSLAGPGDGKLRALGVAGTARSMSPEEMTRSLPPIFKRIADLDASLFHYKVCSTFDSSPAVGSIGRAAELALECVDSPCIPLLIGAPPLKRYTAFANLFAGVEGTTFRIDRHPTMSRHPVTPMSEGDIRVHLGRQTEIPVRSFDLLNMQGPADEVDDRFKKSLGRQREFVLFDVTCNEHLAIIGRLIWENRPARSTFVVGSSGVEYALCNHWQALGLAQRPSEPAGPSAAQRMVVVSGSCSPVTATQINWGLEQGYCGIRLDGPALADPEKRAKEEARATQLALEAVDKGTQPLIFSACGPEDPAIQQTQETLRAHGETGASPSTVLGKSQGRILKALLEKTGIRRVVVAGGDTSGHVTEQLGIFALEMLMPIAPGSPLCTAHSENPLFDGLEISLKGGQVGTREYFEFCRQGKSPLYHPFACTQNQEK